MMSLLDVQNLRTYYFTRRGLLKALDGVNLSLEPEEILGLVGESGSGKSTLAMSIIRLISPPGRIIDGRVLFCGDNLLEKSESYMRKEIRWKQISMVFQGSMNALNPLFRVREQITEAIVLHENIGKAEALEKALELLKMVGIDPSRGKDYPHEFSGGMKQRAVIAMSLACNPRLLIADEPTTALDVLLQAQICELIKSLKEELKLSVIWITHDLPLISGISQKIAVMYAGRLAELSSAAALIEEPLHPYTQILINSVLSIKGPKKRIDTIGGIFPDLLNLPVGCRFHPRCSRVMEVCRREEPEFVEVEKGHYVACHLYTNSKK